MKCLADSGLSDGARGFGTDDTAGDHARGSSSGGVSSGGFYAFDVSGSGDYALGVQPAGSDFTPGYITLKLLNNTGSAITQLDIGYEVWVLNDQDRANSFNFSHSADDSTYTAVAALNFTSTEAADGSPAWAKVDRSTSITSINIANGANYYLRWTGDDVSGGGSRDEFALDDIQVTAIPEPATLGLLFGGSLMIGVIRRRLRG
jgi:hypothetical protein